VALVLLAGVRAALPGWDTLGFGGIFGGICTDKNIETQYWRGLQAFM
jgi:hypothetical protein